MNLQGKVVILTGASSGFGRALASVLAGKGCHLILTDWKAKTGEAFAENVRRSLNPDSLQRIEFYACDVSEKASLDALFSHTIQRHQRIDICINNAGVGERDTHDMAELTQQEWEKVMDIDLTAVVQSTWLAIKQMKKQAEGGVVVNVSSMAGLIDCPKPIYAAAKHGVVGLSKNLGYMAKSHRIRVNTLCPYFSPTPLMTKSGSKLMEKTVKKAGIGMVSIEKVLDGFLLCIEDETLAGDIVTVTPTKGIHVVDKGIFLKSFL